MLDTIEISRRRLVDTGSIQLTLEDPVPPHTAWQYLTIHASLEAPSRRPLLHSALFLTAMSHIPCTTHLPTSNRGCPRIPPSCRYSPHIMRITLRSPNFHPHPHLHKTRHANPRPLFPLPSLRILIINNNTHPLAQSTFNRQGSSYLSVSSISNINS